MKNKPAGHIIDQMGKRGAKKELILSSGLEVMRANGCNGASVKGIGDAAQAPEGSFYNYSAGKEAFAIGAIEQATAESFRDMSAILCNRDLPPVERSGQFFLANFSLANFSLANFSLVNFSLVNIESCSQNSFSAGCFPGNMRQEYGIRSMPTLILFKGGKPVEALNGLQSRTGIKAAIEQYAVQATHWVIIGAGAQSLLEPVRLIRR